MLSSIVAVTTFDNWLTPTEPLTAIDFAAEPPTATLVTKPVIDESTVRSPIE